MKLLNGTYDNTLYEFEPGERVCRLIRKHAVYHDRNDHATDREALRLACIEMTNDLWCRIPDAELTIAAMLYENSDCHSFDTVLRQFSRDYNNDDYRQRIVTELYRMLVGTKY